jgi:hypothetical protein
MTTRGFVFTYVDDYYLDENKKMIKTDKIRSRLGIEERGLSAKEHFLMNKKFVDTLNNWSTKEIKKHLPFMKDKYFDDFVKLYI